MHSQPSNQVEARKRVKTRPLTSSPPLVFRGTFAFETLRSTGFATNAAAAPVFGRSQ